MDVRQGKARFELQILVRKTWRPLVEIELLEARPDIDQAELRFSPFRSGRGITPRSFIQGLRRATYALSQMFRPNK
jgi:hypothetical protein